MPQPADEILTVAEYAKKQYLRPWQRQELEEGVARDKAALYGRMATGEPIPIIPGLPQVNVTDLRENIARDSAMLEVGTPPALNEMQIRKRLQFMKQQEEIIKTGMPSYEQMERPLPVNVDANLAWQQHRTSNVLAWMQVRRELDPDNTEENFTSVEILRSTQPPTVDLRQYWDRYDLIAFEKEVVSEMPPLDEGTYHRFCMLKARDWAPKNIMRELALSKEQYEQCMQRIRDEMPEPPAEETDEAETSPATEIMLGQMADGDSPDTLAQEGMSTGQPGEGNNGEGFWLQAELKRLRIGRDRFAKELHLPKKLAQAYLSQRRGMSKKMEKRVREYLAAHDESLTTHASA